jgi:hypothetical protein
MRVLRLAAYVFGFIEPFKPDAAVWMARFVREGVP